MSAARTLTPGANAPLEGTAVQISLEVPQLGGATVLVEAAGAPLRAVANDEAFAQLDRRDERTLVASFDLASVPAGVERLRLMVWSPGPDLALAKVTAAGTIDAAPAFAITLPEDARALKAVELLELYRRGDAWKVRAIASGWHHHVAGMAAAVGLPASAFPVQAVRTPTPPAAPGPEAPSASAAHAASPAGSVPPRPSESASPAPPHVGPSPAIGPPALRDVLDNVVGPGARVGDDSFVDFELHGVFLRLTYESGGDYARVIATTPGGEGTLTDTVGLAALRATGEAPLGRVSFDQDGAAFISAPAVAERRHVDSALVKALLAEVWVTAYRFGERIRTARWSFPSQLTEQIPRELRLGVGEELQDVGAWAPVRERLEETHCIPLVDEPSAMLAPTTLGQLVIGPALLAGTPRGWTILVERTVRSNVRPRPGLWTRLANHNAEQFFVRFSVQAEGLPGDPPAIVVGYSALQLPRTQVMEDLSRGLDMVDEASDAVDPLLRELAADSADYRNNLPWVATRRWTGPGSELRDHLLVREISGLPAGADVPAQLVKRVRGQADSLGRSGFGYLAHLALLRAEAKDGASPAWHAVARDLVALAPVQPEPGDAPCATASVHVRLSRLDAPRPMRPPPPPSPPAGAPEPRRRRRGLFG